jgi:hypothetical protein
MCNQAQPVGIAKGILLGVDTALERADRNPIFGPILGSALKTILPKSKVQTKIADIIKKPVAEIEANNKEINELSDIINQVSN